MLNVFNKDRKLIECEKYFEKNNFKISYADNWFMNNT